VVEIVGRCDLACEGCDDRWASTILVKAKNYIRQMERKYDDQLFVFASCMVFKLCRVLDCVVEDRPFAYFKPPFDIV